MWLVIFLFFIYTSITFVLDIYFNASTNQFSLAINPKSTPIWDIPFPAVLVCSVYPVRKSVFDLEKETNKKYRHFSKLVCPSKDDFGSEVFNDTLNEEFFEFISKAAIPCEDLIVNCYWRNRKIDCCTVFKPLITSLGQCYVFNSNPGEVLYRDYSPPLGVEMIYDDDLLFWSAVTGYPNRSELRGKVRPRWSEFNGPLSGLTFDLLDAREEWQETCANGFSGFQLGVYPPDGDSEVEMKIKIPSDIHSHIQVYPTYIRTDDDVRSISMQERECVFEEEIQLDYYQVYDQKSCKIECFTKESIRLCGCITFSSYRIMGMWSYPYCNDTAYACINTVVKHLSVMKTASMNENTCRCLASCNMLTYEFQTSFQQIVTPNIPSWTEGYNQSSGKNIARASVYFRVQQFHAINRKRTSSFGEVLGNCGGLLGLFLGFSFMSLFEVVYFAVIRPLNRIITYYFTHGFK